MLKTGVINVAHSGLEGGGKGISIGEFLFVPTTFASSKMLRIFFFDILLASLFDFKDISFWESMWLEIFKMY